MRAESSATDLLWGRGGRRSRGPKPVLSVEQIAQAAVDIADTEGLAAVTMQRVADQFGFTAMSLYRYVPGRAELVGLMIDVATGVAPVIDTSGGWQPALRTWTQEIYRVFRRHAWLAQATIRARPVGPRELSWLERAVAILAGSPLTGPERVDAVLVLIGHVRNQVQAETGIAADDGAQLGAALNQKLREHAADYPALSEAAGDGAFGPGDNDGFEFGVRCILDGIAATIAARPA